MEGTEVRVMVAGNSRTPKHGCPQALSRMTVLDSGVVTAPFPPSKELSRRLRHWVGSALDRYGLRPSKELVARVEELELTIRGVTARLSEVQDAVNTAEIPNVMNGSSGHLAVSRHRPIFAKFVVDGSSNPQPLESVESDAGTLLFPAFDRYILPSIREYGYWEPDEVGHLRSRLSPGMTVVDIGANVGYTALVISRAVGEKGLVIALEPEQLNFELLSSNLRRNHAANVVAIHAAAGEQTGSITLQRSPDNAGDHRTAPHPMGVAPQEVPLIAMDDLLPPQQVVDFVFIDAQGYDHRVLRGMRSTIERCRPPMLLEFWPVGILELGDDPDEVLSEYRELGYRVELLPDKDVSALSAEQILMHSEKDHVTLSLVPA
jgi:FkbM family methyltransferase